MMRRKKIIVGNWKMNPASLKEALKIFNEIKRTAGRQKSTVVICPPFIYLNQFKKGRILLGAQDVSKETKGAHTGEISAEMLAKGGANYVIVGHSERRDMGETDEVVNKKIEAALEQNLKIILCVGESSRDENGEYLNFIKQQLRDSLKRIGRRYIRNIIIAYEPLSAIGNKAFQAMSPYEIHQMVIFIRKNLIDHFTDDEAKNIPIIYGGSVNAENAGEIINGGEVDGFLPGRQSLNPDQFLEIVKATKN